MVVAIASCLGFRVTVGGVRGVTVGVMVVVIAAVTLGLVAGVSGCGNVNFVDAPFAPRHVDVIYSVQEDVTAIRWRLSATDPDPDVSFELLDAGGKWQPIDFTSSVYMGGVNRCGDPKGGLCAQMVVRGRYRPPADALSPVRSRNPTFDVSPGNQYDLHDYTSTIGLSTHFSRDNGGLVTTIQDVIGGDPTFLFPRPLERATWERRGVCVPGFFPSDAQFSPVTGLTDAWPAPAPLSDDGLYCAAVRPVMTNLDRGADVQLAIDTVPEVYNNDLTYTVPTEVTPFSYRIVLDVSIPVADLCQQAIAGIQTTVANSLGRRSPLRQLPLIDLSATDPEPDQPVIPCRQSPLRAINASEVAQDVKTAAASWTEQHPRFFLLYFNNLRAPLPPTLTTSLADFSATILNPRPAADLQAQLWPFGPPEMTDSFGGWGMQMTPWSSASDADFAMQLDSWALRALPMVSEIPDPTKPIPLLTGNQPADLDGGLLRLCQISITPLQDTGLTLKVRDDAGGLVTLDPTAHEHPIDAANPPGFVLALPPVWSMPKSSFTPHQAYIRFEVCTRYCGHPFTSEAGVPVSAGWIGNPLCVGPASGAKG